jgi:4-amino-4-deoxy-L-arabinose transferase-like glycosyltransferase
MTTPRRDSLPIIALWIFLGACAVLFVALGATPIERTSEKRCHEVAVTMLETGDYLVPYYDGEPRLQKPPLYYWLAAASQ